MSAEHYYGVCNENVGRAVEITCYDGSVHRGIIERVNNESVHLRPIEEGYLNDSNDFGTYLYGFGYGYGYGIALASIAALAFLPFFFW
ncbi:hypothetical protein [Bacillus taeanensis]|uniref:Uncharacterized protein n=1 Tax=Bacillus taeanensis TaxID=273032 RepID=A0A366XX82_9BACI|nr:hypothetical protein [Bacillus taeanensis]RBW70178.1 hypothetical protein DS031_08295 [Bacillus taeanensis]